MRFHCSKLNYVSLVDKQSFLIFQLYVRMMKNDKERAEVDETER